MARESKRLVSATLTGSALGPGRYADGDNLYFVVDPKGAKRWAFIYRWREPGQKGAGKLREMGLGSFKKVDLRTARGKADDARRLLGSGIDPIANAKATADIPTFGAMADQWMEKRFKEGLGDTSKARIKRALEHHAAPIRARRVDLISQDDVLGVLKPLWETKPETAQKLRGYIETVLDAAKAAGKRNGENPARWRGHLSHLLSKQRKLVRGHHPALHYTEVSALVLQLRERDATSALALEFLILAAARSGEVREATWDEIDLDAKTWVLPGSRMKAGREHRVPLSPRMVEILEKMKKGRTGALVFPSLKKDRPMSVMAFDRLLARMKRDGFTVHGFRSSFRDWALECTNFPGELAEGALAHTVGDATERAYRRGDALEKRRKLMVAWAVYCSRPPPSGKVIQLRSVG